MAEGGRRLVVQGESENVEEKLVVRGTEDAGWGRGGFCFYLSYLKYLFIYLWLGQVFVSARALSSFGERGLRSSCAQASHCSGFSC